jgi:hypothetical protein
VGPNTGDAATSPNVWEKSLTYTPAPSGTKFIILHFMNVTLPASNRLEVDLGYDTDVFTAASGGSFWTRPINVGVVGASIKIRYITNGAANGGAFVDRYGRGESLQSTEPGHNSITNCNPFLVGGWAEPNFPHIPGSTAPKYDPFWICNKTAAPKWQNVRLHAGRLCPGEGRAKRRDDRDSPPAKRGPSGRKREHLFGHADRLGPGRPGGALHCGPPVRGADEFRDVRL